MDINSNLEEICTDKAEIDEYRTRQIYRIFPDEGLSVSIQVEVPTYVHLGHLFDIAEIAWNEMKQNLPENHLKNIRENLEDVNHRFQTTMQDILYKKSFALKED